MWTARISVQMFSTIITGFKNTLTRMQYIYSLSLSAVVVKVNLTSLWLFKNSEEF